MNPPLDSCNTTGACGSFATRPDRPHTFFCHQMSSCAECDAPIEGRVVLREGAVFNLVHCPGCGQSERLLHSDSSVWVAQFLDRARSARVFKQTTSTCPSCLKLLLVDVVIEDKKVWFDKRCTDCGPSRALVSEDAEYYVNAYAYARAGTEPLRFGAPVQHGCPTDCGTCNDHEQHSCLPIVEVTDHCNLECPICIVANHYSTHMPVEKFAKIIENMVIAEGFCESIAISGGEPTSHPQFWELIDAATRPEIGRVVVITNGLRLGRDRVFAQRIKDSGAYIALQIDGFDDSAHRAISGRNLQAEKDAALNMLAELNIPTQLIFVAVRGVNEHQIGKAVELLFSGDHLLSLNFQPIAYTGLGGGRFAHDPLDRLTIPGVIRRIEEQTDGFLKRSDFSPLPCSHPQCVSLTYLLKLDDHSWLPFSRFIDFREHGALLRSSATLVASPEIEEALADVVNEVFANEDRIDRGDEVLSALRRCVDEMFPQREVSPQQAIRIGEGQAKSIFLHHYMDRHDFDLERLRKCCHHYAQEDGRVMPACGFNMFHRGAVKGEAC